MLLLPEIPPELDIDFRNMINEDYGFVESLYASTRAEELANTGWPSEMQRAFLAQQHQAQHRHYQAHYDGAEWLIIERRGQPIGRLYLVEWPDDVRVIDISLVPDCRGQGIGSAILRAVIASAHASGRSASLHTESNNRRALGLYERLGFRLREDKGAYLLLECAPAPDEEKAPGKGSGA
ncbi:MAG TPA: GNAT family N-acetyltransferase [Allosphingosinicella sp.]|jgi:ribosomal protein S18 acetylase RimI-like enzyme